MKNILRHTVSKREKEYKQRNRNELGVISYNKRATLKETQLFSYKKLLLSTNKLEKILLQFSTACQDYQAGEIAVKCLSKDTTEWRKCVLNLHHADYQSGALTTRPRYRLISH